MTNQFIGLIYLPKKKIYKAYIAKHCNNPSIIHGINNPYKSRESWLSRWTRRRSITTYDNEHIFSDTITLKLLFSWRQQIKIEKLKKKNLFISGFSTQTILSLWSLHFWFSKDLVAIKSGKNLWHSTQYMTLLFNWLLLVMCPINSRNRL